MTTNTQFPPVNFVVWEISYIFRRFKTWKPVLHNENKQTNKQTIFAYELCSTGHQFIFSPCEKNCSVPGARRNQPCTMTTNIQFPPVNFVAGDIA